MKLDPQNLGQEQYNNLKSLTMEIYRLLIEQINIITQNSNMSEKYFKLSDSKKSGFEEFCMQFSLGLISFFKSNFSFIQQFDFQMGYCNGNEFTAKYLSEIYRGLEYIAQIYLIPNDEIFNALSEFWNWFCFKVCFLQEREINPENGIPAAVNSISVFNSYIQFTNESYIYRTCYSKILESVRFSIIKKMTKPIEVKIDLDEDGEIVMDQITNTIYQTLHENMKDCLIFLTHLDPSATEKIMLDLLLNQTIESEWNPSLLNSLCWSIGCITGAMEENHEKRFVIMVIKHLLNLCELKRGKTNKAIVASNIMYVVGQYPRFLNAHWKFLKTVIKKLFEFMHESHPGVQDFACETFMKISIKCGDQLVKVNEGENEPYINVLTRSIRDDTADLQSHQKLMFYEAIGNMIDRDADLSRKAELIKKMMEPTYLDWSTIFSQATQNPEILQNHQSIKAMDLIIKLNERVALATKTVYFSFGTYVFSDIINAYSYYTGLVNEIYNGGNVQSTPAKMFKNIKKTILKFIITMVHANEDAGMIMNSILPALGNLIESYRLAHVENR